MAIELIVALGIAAFIYLYAAFHLEKDHTVLKVFLFTIVMLFPFLLAQAANDGNPLTTEDGSFVFITTNLIWLVYIYLFIYAFYKWGTLVADKIKSGFNKKQWKKTLLSR